MHERRVYITLSQILNKYVDHPGKLALVSSNAVPNTRLGNIGTIGKSKTTRAITIPGIVAGFTMTRFQYPRLGCRLLAITQSLRHLMDKNIDLMKGYLKILIRLLITDEVIQYFDQNNESNY